MAFRMLKQNSIHLLGSDCHNLHSRKPNLRAPLELIERRMGAAPLAAIQESQVYALQNE
jgi:tyrosine-protein phosphatase YwqE